MFACIPMLLLALFPYAIHRICISQNKMYREMELTKSEGIIDHTYMKSGTTKYYIRFHVDGRTVVEAASGRYDRSIHSYYTGVHVPIGYHVNEKGIITVFIDDERLEANKNPTTSNACLYFSIFMVGLTIFYAIKTLLGY